MERIIKESCENKLARNNYGKSINEIMISLKFLTVTSLPLEGASSKNEVLCLTLCVKGFITRKTD
jgi:hypothetical protein